MPTSDAPSGPADATPSPAGMPRALLAVVAGVGLEVVAMVVFAGAMIVDLVVGQAESLGVSLFTAAFFLALAWLLGWSARALWQGRRGGRSPVAGWQIFQGLIAIALLTSGSLVVTLGGVLVLALAAGVLVCLMTRGVVEHTLG